jgi:hypothetical protein
VPWPVQRWLEGGVDRGKQLHVIAAVAWRFLDMSPSDHAVAVEEKVRAIREESFFE